MSERQLETLRLMAQDIGLSLSSRHIRAAATDRAAFLTRLNELRKVRLLFIGAIEPAHVWLWILRRGHSIENTKLLERKGP